LYHLPRKRETIDERPSGMRISRRLRPLPGDGDLENADLPSPGSPGPDSRRHHWSAPPIARQIRALSLSLREHSLVIAMVLVHLAIGAAMPWFLGRDLRFAVQVGPTVSVTGIISLWCILITASIGVMVAAIRRSGGQRPLAAAWHWLSVQFLRPDRIWGALIFLLLFPVFAWNFSFIQAMLPLLHKLDWDSTFAAWDRLLHFGRQPWEWLQPWIGYPVVTSALSLFYGVWYLVLYGVLVWQAFARRDPLLRMQFLLCSILVWAVLGNLVGTLLASGGPVYYGRITGMEDPFAGLVAYLNAAAAQWPNLALDIQEKMWSLYLINGRHGEINGAIEAMPSLHVATSCTFYLVARATDRRLGWIFGAFLLVMLIGSVHLAWHYAIDGYAGIAGTVLLWWACGRFLRWPPVHRMLWGNATGEHRSRLSFH
jgi:hypothetical protein